MSNLEPEITLAVDGARYAGWTDASVTRSLEALADSFSLSFTTAAEARVIKPGAQCVVQLGAHKLITGYANSLDVDVSADAISSTLSGRSSAGDLTDCCAVHKTGQWRRAGLVQIIRDLCAPFGIAVSADPAIAADPFKFERFELDEGERVFDAMDRLLRATGVTPVSQADGSLRLFRVSDASGLRSVQLRPETSSGRQLTSVDQDTFSVYRLRSQTGRANPEESPRHAALESFEARDPNVARYRPFVLNADTGARVAELQDKARWECNTRHAQSLRVTYTLPGGLAPDGQPWAPPMLVLVDDRVLGVREILLLITAELRCSNSDYSTRIVLTYPEAYSLKPLPVRLLNKGVSLRG